MDREECPKNEAKCPEEVTACGVTAKVAVQRMDHLSRAGRVHVRPCGKLTA